jgi:hypothetical protein
VEIRQALVPNRRAERGGHVLPALDAVKAGVRLESDDLHAARAQRRRDPAYPTPGMIRVYIPTRQGEDRAWCTQARCDGGLQGGIQPLCCGKASAKMRFVFPIPQQPACFKALGTLKASNDVQEDSPVVMER